MVRILKGTPDMKKMKAFFAKVAAFFSSGEAAKALDAAAALVPKAIPYIDLAAEIGAGLAPSGVPAAVLADIHAKFPRLFDGSLKGADEVKLYLLGVASQLLKVKFPQVSTSVARAAVQVAYTAVHSA
jgi:hypothetical protein